MKPWNRNCWKPFCIQNGLILIVLVLGFIFRSIELWCTALSPPFSHAFLCQLWIMQIEKLSLLFSYDQIWLNTIFPRAGKPELLHQIGSQYCKAVSGEIPSAQRQRFLLLLCLPEKTQPGMVWISLSTVCNPNVESMSRINQMHL